MPKLPPWLFVALTSVITVLWAAAIVLSAVPRTTFHMPDSLNAAFTVVLAALFAGRRKDDDDDD